MLADLYSSVALCRTSLKLLLTLRHCLCRLLLGVDGGASCSAAGCAEQALDRTKWTLTAEQIWKQNLLVDHVGRITRNLLACKDAQFTQPRSALARCDHPLRESRALTMR